jgi:hypothetical protein
MELLGQKVDVSSLAYGSKEFHRACRIIEVDPVLRNDEAVAMFILKIDPCQISIFNKDFFFNLEVTKVMLKNRRGPLWIPTKLHTDPAFIDFVFRECPD